MVGIRKPRTKRPFDMGIFEVARSSRCPGGKIRRAPRAANIVLASGYLILIWLPRTLARADGCRGVRASLAARTRIGDLYGDYSRRSGVAAMVFPTTLVPAPAIDAGMTVQAGASALPFNVAVARNISPGSTAGVPGPVLPAGLTRDGLPVSVELDGPAGSDRALLALGLGVERALGPIERPREPYRKSASS
jgi:Asp-tRNA(Asn)/Glu-tRNA(Gln) amidotransferase A subunit family amidase